ncbi:MAG TPA: DUF4333 domain-containing protein [Mycobacteriales bacterium]|nr:DUF4333 domain-containing protein [Mycobacteriales bacterium]
MPERRQVGHDGQVRRAVVAFLPLLLAGCGANDVDRAQLEVQVQRSLEQQGDPALRSPTVSCPDKLKAATGAQTHCTVTTRAGKKIDALVTVTGTAHNRVQFDLKLDQNPAS